MFQLLLDMGFKEIEIGFPSAFADGLRLRPLGHRGRRRGPTTCPLQVLVQCRPELITSDLRSAAGRSNPIVHFYNSTSELQRRVSSPRMSPGIKQIATDAAKMNTDMAAKAGGGFRFEYSRPRASPARSWRLRWKSATRSPRS